MLRISCQKNYKFISLNTDQSNNETLKIIYFIRLLLFNFLKMNFFVFDSWKTNYKILLSIKIEILWAIPKQKINNILKQKRIQ